MGLTILIVWSSIVLLVVLYDTTSTFSLDKWLGLLVSFKKFFDLLISENVVTYSAPFGRLNSTWRVLVRARTAFFKRIKCLERGRERGLVVAYEVARRRSGKEITFFVLVGLGCIL